MNIRASQLCLSTMCCFTQVVRAVSEEKGKEGGTGNKGIERKGERKGGGDKERRGGILKGKEEREGEGK